MILVALGCNHRTAPVAVREKLAFPDSKLPHALDELTRQPGWEAAILSTCNRIEVYLAHPLTRKEEGGRREEEGVSSSSFLLPPSSLQEDPAEATLQFLARFHGMCPEVLRPHLYCRSHAEAVTHLLRVAAGLDSMVLGEGQIAGQVKVAFEKAQQYGALGPLLHLLFRHARQAARRVRTETGIARGCVSVSSAAIDYVQQVFDHFGDKTVLVIGAGKMGELTLRHLRRLQPARILVTNRSPEKARAVAEGCGGEAVPWENLDDVLAQADIVLSTTGAPEPVVTRQRYAGILARRDKGTLVILDIAVPRDFDPAIHDGDQTCLFNIDDLNKIKDATLAERQRHVPAAEEIVRQEARAFLKEWARRQNGPLIERLTQDLDAKREAVVRRVLARLNGRLGDEDRRFLEQAFVRLQNQFLHGPISALTEETQAGSGHAGHTLLDALRKLFRLAE